MSSTPRRPRTKKATHGLWIYDELYVHGNRRVARFIQGGGTLVPISERWARARDACAPEPPPTAHYHLPARSTK